MKITRISQKLAGLVLAGAVLASGTVQAAPVTPRIDKAVESQSQVEKVGHRRYYRHGGFHRGHRFYGHRRGRDIGAGIALGALGFVAGAALASNYAYGGYYGGYRPYYGGYGYYPRRRKVIVKHVYHHPYGYGYQRRYHRGHYGW